MPFLQQYTAGCQDFFELNVANDETWIHHQKLNKNKKKDKHGVEESRFPMKQEGKGREDGWQNDVHCLLVSERCITGQFLGEGGCIRSSQVKYPTTAGLPVRV
ncbi:hypothetical protein AVEN_273051-1 [Araneus ventricosus]|uniref:Uncharacterized protein n=1 Tax=Araneus ventricosus TaxID=182803 RepID=A0A4Y2RFP7_ARAVE|nr:hypothetical protein AVEN_273051-1 [Araneus ventricosus]